MLTCHTCQYGYAYVDSGTCKWCYEQVSKNEEKLKAKINFLGFQPFESRHHFTDVVLMAYNEDSGKPAANSVPIPAHKVVLASRSPVFKSILESEKEEIPNGTNTIKVNDVSYDALREFVKYLYTAEALLDEKMACDLLVLAEKYKVMHLKGYCEEFLIEKLNWENALKSYSFAHKHNAKNMLDATLPLIFGNTEKLIKSEEYKELVEKDPRLVIEIHEAYLSKLVRTAADESR